MLTATPDGTAIGTTNARHAGLFAAARQVAAVLDADFVGHVEIYIYKGGVHATKKGGVRAVKVVQSFLPPTEGIVAGAREAGPVRA
jgi:hypothetical protein